MQVSTLLLAGGISAALLIGYAGFRILRRRSGTTLLHIVFALLAIGLVFAALVQGRLTAAAPGAESIALAIAAGLLVVGIAAAVLEYRRQAALNRASGLVVAGAGVLLGALVLVTPLTVSRITVAREQRSASPTAVVQSVAWARTEEAPSLPTNTPQVPVAASLPKRTFALTPLPTRYTPATPTAALALDQAVEDGALAPACIGTVQNNLNLRTGAGTDYERLTTIPYSTRIDIYAQNAVASWLAVGYDGQTGWVSADYVILDAACEHLPQRNS